MKITNKKPTNSLGQAKHRATQLKTSAGIMYVISGDLASYRGGVTAGVADLFDSLPARPVSCTFMQYSITFCSRLKEAMWCRHTTHIQHAYEAFRRP